jgi:hypothetical protein
MATLPIEKHDPMATFGIFERDKAAGEAPADDGDPLHHAWFFSAIFRLMSSSPQA